MRIKKTQRKLTLSPQRKIIQTFEMGSTVAVAICELRLGPLGAEGHFACKGKVTKGKNLALPEM